ncbi:hypothetical protein BDZ89DRAFT_1133137 [Hymenopellis radicata]|nr:hypothetical protein BDZ89DRAFT_1133137 [Hymenopellis radicata]
MNASKPVPSGDHYVQEDGGEFAMITILAFVGFIWYTVMWIISIIGCQAGRRRYKLRPRSPLSSAPANSVPGVSVLRPLRGLDTNLYENLESTFTQDLPIVRELMAKYPNVPSSIIVGEEVVGVNPKVNNLVHSNVMAAPGTMARSVDALQGHDRNGRRIALVHHVPFAYATESRIGSRIDEAFLNTNHAKMYLAINAVAVDSCVVGKSNLYRRSDVERLNGSLKPMAKQVPEDTPAIGRGFPAFGRFMAEDNMIASALWHELDLRHDLSCDVVRNVVGKMSLKDYILRRARWIRVRKHMVLSATILEPFTESVVVSAIGAASFKHLLGIPVLPFVLFHYIAWLSVDLDVYASLAGHPLPDAVRWEFLAGWVVRELLTLPIFLYAVFGREVTWRGRKYQMLHNGEVKLVGEQSPRRRWPWSRTPKHYQPVDVEDASS